ncbi:hypothetical protein SDC9_116097 [bioreactor metagenome]|jgi:hypothetical protein|uniref:DUF4032 domain-containing protein n=2 Tax=root TaxID=1 RepID=A0ABY4D9U0_9SPIR|nr:DUF4032 domain-containing protein [Sphaerochaeta associata]MDT3357787.1 DUF4032 domain-containing protein [Spirochaetota bacterium]UOM49809.1 DUF4032 domain-containing protein [Sphaerochaeta associata]SMP47725.1 protein of unknown function [Sphaerochaeta associata]
MDKNDLHKKESIEFLIKNTDMFLDADYNKLASHIEGHRYFLGKNLNMPITWDEAVYSWMSNLYEPISQVMETWTTQMSFPGKRKADLFFEVCDHLYYLSVEKQKEVNAYDAVLDYNAQYGKTIGRILAKLLSIKYAA